MRTQELQTTVGPSLPSPNDDLGEDREFNRYTLLGEYDPLFIALLKERCRWDGIDFSLLSEYFRAHLNRGIILLQACVRSVGDIAVLLPRTDQQTPATLTLSEET